MNAPWRACGVLALAASACASRSVPFPAHAPEPSAAEFSEVPDIPPAPPPEVIRPKATPNAVWVDGQWDRVDDNWRWARGSWVVPPAGARFTAYRIRREKDGSLHFAAARWVDAQGKTIDVQKATGTDEAQ